MKPFDFIFILVLFIFTNCSTAQKLQKSAPISLGEVYSQSWVAGVKGGGSGINLFIPVLNELPPNMQLDSVYFRGKGTKLEIAANNPSLYIGRFSGKFNQKQDIIMSNDSKEEYGNQLPIKQEEIPFDLKDNECVVSYKDSNSSKYFKIENITEKKSEHYPSAPQNKQ